MGRITAPTAKVAALATPPDAGLDPAGRVNVFISYRHEDRVIATTLKDALTEINRERVDCFLDCESIGAGEGWEQELADALDRADWLVSIYTGRQSEYCGYEVGVFTRGKLGLAGPNDFRLACLHDVPELPGLLRAHQNTFVSPRPTGSVAAPDNVSPAGWPPEEAVFYRQSNLFAFLDSFCAYRGLYVPRAEREHAQKQDLLLAAAKRLTLAFVAAHGTEVQTDTPTQLTLSVRFVSEAAAIDAIPGQATVTGTFASFALFGLMPAMQNRQLPATTWDEVRAACQGRSAANALWMYSLEREMVNVASGKLPGSPEAVFMSALGQKVFRPILVRRIVLNNGSNEFQVVFVETLPRQFVGFQKTSLLLAGLVLASRFRFSYLEETDRVAALFDEARSDLEFAINCKQLEYDIARIQSESLELGVVDGQAFIAAFGEKRRAVAESFGKVWETAKAALLPALPPHDAPLQPERRAAAREAITKFLRDMASENRRFVLAALDAYRDEVGMHG